MNLTAVRLFLDRACTVDPDFVVDLESIALVGKICRRLDGIPLALELAAARVKVLRLEEIAERLDDRFRLLTSGSASALPHHQTLRALIDWSYHNLPEAEQAVLRRLAIFAGGWSLQAAEAVCKGETIESWEVLDLMSNLVDKSLVEVDRERGKRTLRARYRMLETVREYARDQLAGTEEEPEARVRHRDLMLAVAQEANPHLSGKESALWFERLRTGTWQLPDGARSGTVG